MKKNHDLQHKEEESKAFLERFSKLSLDAKNQIIGALAALEAAETNKKMAFKTDQKNPLGKATA